MRRSRPRRISTALAGVRARTSPPTPLAAVQEVWAGVVGEAIARKAAPVAERDGVLTVACRTAAWASELDLLQLELLERLNPHLEVPLRAIRTTADASAAELIDEPPD